MDLATVVGIVMALGAIVAAFVMDGGSVIVLVAHPTALMLVIGGTIGMTMIGFPMSQMSKLHKIIMSGFFPPKMEPPEKLVEALVAMAEKARKEGLLALQDDVAKLDSPLLVRGLNMIVDGADPEVVRHSLEEQVAMAKGHMNGQAAILEAAGGFSPTVGIIGTVSGLLLVLGHLSEGAEKLGEGIATAFMATFYGVFFANLFWLPLGSKIKYYAKEQEHVAKMVITGLVSLQAGENPRSIKEKLEAFLHTEKPKAAKAGG